MFEDLILKPEVLDLWTSLMDKISLPENFEKYLFFLPIFIIGFLFTFILTPIIGNFAKKNDIVYVPNTRRKNKDFENPEKALHKGIIPALGGLAVLIPFFLLVLFCFRINSTTLPFIIGLGILMIGGILDDVINLPAKVQLILQLIAATFVVSSIFDLNSFTLFNTTISMDILKFTPEIGDFIFSFVFPGDFILLIWLVFCINSFKWIGGSPGLIEGNALITISLIFIISIRYQILFSSTVSALLVGSLLAFLIFAYPPPLIMSGSSGKSVYGLLICSLSLICENKFATTLILLLFPTLDAIYVLVRRYIEYKPKNPFELIQISGATHFHHQLLKLNLSQKTVFWIEILIALLIGSFATITTGAYRYLLLIAGLILVISIILYSNLKNRDGDKAKEESSESKYSY